jgi:hypothetical protein
MGLPYLEDKAVKEIKAFVKQKALKLGVEEDSKEAWLSYDEILTINKNKPVKAYQLNIDWANELVKKGYTIIDMVIPII